MPTYSYECPECGEFEARASMSDYNLPQTCPDCGASGKRIIGQAVPSFILKGDDWVGKNLRIKGQMADRRQRLGKREDEMRREAPGMTLAPNVDGERVSSWSDAQKLAASKGKNTESYTAKIREEKKKA